MVQLSSTFGALADENRRLVLAHLAEHGAATATELAEPLGITVTGLLKHVAVLEGAGLVASLKQGRTRVCQLGPGGLDEAADWITTHRRRWERRLDRFDDYVRRAQQGDLS